MTNVSELIKWIDKTIEQPKPECEMPTADRIQQLKAVKRMLLLERKKK